MRVRIRQDSDGWTVDTRKWWCLEWEETYYFTNYNNMLDYIKELLDLKTIEVTEWVIG